jgi:hypothetical protein
VSPVPDSRAESVGSARRREKSAALLFNALDAFGCRMTVVEGKGDAKRNELKSTNLK